MTIYSDSYATQMIDVWCGLKDSCWFFLWSPSFWQTLALHSECCKKTESINQAKSLTGAFPWHGGSSAAHGTRFWLTKIQVWITIQFNHGSGQEVYSESDGNIRKALSLYIQRFVYSFTHDFVPKTFETLNAEMKLEHHAFFKAFK